MGTSPPMGLLLVTLLFIISSIIQHINAQDYSTSYWYQQCPVTMSNYSQTTHCTVQHFQCNDGACILRSCLCDGEVDCSDGSDETNCTSRPKGCTLPNTGNFVGGTIRAAFQEVDDLLTLNANPANYRAFLGITASPFDVTLRLVHKDPDYPAVLEPGDTFDLVYLTNEPTGTNLGTQTGYFLQLKNSVDRDGQLPDPSDDIDSLQYTLECTETGRPVFKNFKTVRVIFNDINDNTPIFTQSLYEGSVNELTPIGLTVFQGLAYTDLDEGGNGDGDYAILPGDGSVFDGFTRFKIDVSSQGEVSVKNTLDFEVLNNAVPKRLTYQMNISITDRGQPPRTGYSTLALTVTDADDLPPECLVSEHSSSTTAEMTSLSQEITPVSTSTVVTGDTCPSSDSKNVVIIVLGCLYIVPVLIIILLVVYFKRQLNLIRKSQEQQHYDHLAIHSNETTTAQDQSGYLTVQETKIHPYVNGDIASNNTGEATYDLVL